MSRPARVWRLASLLVAGVFSTLPSVLVVERHTGLRSQQRGIAWIISDAAVRGNMSVILRERVLHVRIVRWKYLLVRARVSYFPHEIITCELSLEKLWRDDTVTGHAQLFPFGFSVHAKRPSATSVSAAGTQERCLPPLPPGSISRGP